jgi:hypothetical protein
VARRFSFASTIAAGLQARQFTTVPERPLWLHAVEDRSAWAYLLGLDKRILK